jgi:CRISPR-associated protein Csm5
MRYKVTCLTPTLVVDGQRLAPIDYMVWRDHVNVLDQKRIFKLLARGPKLDGYLAQLKKADRLDFASWGGFAQNFAGRRIPFEHSSSIPVIERARVEHLFIPTFATATSGQPFLPATAIKGALRTGAVNDRWTEGTFRDLAERMAGERPPRNPAAKLEDVPRAKRVGAGDSNTVLHTAMKVHLVKVATMQQRAGKLELGWKESAPLFAEMAIAGTAFEGAWSEKTAQDRTRLFQSANKYAAGQLVRHKQYAVQAGLPRVTALAEALESRLQEVSTRQNICLLSVGWGGGLHSKVAYLETDNAAFRSVARQYPYFENAIRTGLPFPKTRRVIFEGGQPASLPGWVMLEVE